MRNIKVIKQNSRKAESEISKFKNELVTVTSHGQHLSFWGTQSLNGIFLGNKKIRKLHNIDLLLSSFKDYHLDEQCEETYVRTFEANDFQFQFFAIESPTDTLFVDNFPKDYTREEKIKSLTDAELTHLIPHI